MSPYITSYTLNLNQTVDLIPLLSHNLPSKYQYPYNHKSKYQFLPPLHNIPQGIYKNSTYAFPLHPLKKHKD